MARAQSQPWSRPPAQLWDEVYKKRKDFYEAMGKLSADDIKGAIPIHFPVCHVIDKETFPGVSRFPVQEAIDSGEEAMTAVRWCLFCMAVAKQDMKRLDTIFTVAEGTAERLGQEAAKL